MREIRYWMGVESPVSRKQSIRSDERIINQKIRVSICLTVSFDFSPHPHGPLNTASPLFPSGVFLADEGDDKSLVCENIGVPSFATTLDSYRNIGVTICDNIKPKTLSPKSQFPCSEPWILICNHMAALKKCFSDLPRSASFL